MSGKRSKVLQRLAERHPHIVKEYWCDSDGHWLFLHDGYEIEGCGSCHGQTVVETLSDWNNVRQVASPSKLGEV